MDHGSRGIRSLADQPGPRSLDQTLTDLNAKMRSLPLTHPDRGPIARQIVGIEDELDRRRAVALAQMGVL